MTTTIHELNEKIQHAIAQIEHYENSVTVFNDLFRDAYLNAYNELKEFYSIEHKALTSTLAIRKSLDIKHLQQPGSPAFVSL